jgi:hypothetical protein
MLLVPWQPWQFVLMRGKGKGIEAKKISDLNP